MANTYSKGAGRIDVGSSNSVVGFVLVGEVFVHDVESFLIYLQVVVLLEVVNGDHTTGFLDVQRVLVDSSWPCSLFVQLANLQNIVQTIERDLDDFVVHHSQKIAQRLDTALGNEIANLLWILKATGGCVGNRPARLFLCFEVSIL